MSTSHVQAFSAKPRTPGNSPSRAIALGLIVGGVGMGALAIATAVLSSSSGGLGAVVDVLDRLGFDKGPLAAFGLLSAALGIAIGQLERAREAAAAAEEAAENALACAQDNDAQPAILGALQAEICALRQEVAEGRREAVEALAETGSPDGQASDPIFRLAASLDQLGAQVDKRISNLRHEVLDSVQGIASSMEVGAEQGERAQDRTSKDVDALRMDIADVRANLTRIGDEIGDLARQASAAAPLPAPRPSPSPEPTGTDSTSVTDQDQPTLPRELNEPDGPIPSSSTATGATSNPASSVAAPSTGDRHGTSGSQTPPAPVPSQAEARPTPVEEPVAEPTGLRLIDEMDDGTARKDDTTPPLFPELDELNG